MSRLRVLRVVPTIDPVAGGPSHSAVNAAIAESGPSVQSTVVTTSGSDPESELESATKKLEAANVGVFAFPRLRRFGRRGLTWGLSLRMNIWIARNIRKYDIVHLHYVWCLTTLVGGWAGRRSGIPVVLTGHESLTDYDIDITSGSSAKRRLKLFLRKVIMRNVSTVVCSSELELHDSLKPGERGVVISHPVVEEANAVTRSRRETTLVIGYLGRLHPKKGIERLLRAFSSLDSRARMIVCGSGESEFVDGLLALASELGVASRIEWRGHVGPAGKAELFRLAHWMVMPSDYECFGMSGAEAISAGVPVIVSSQSGIAPVVHDFGCGLAVDPSDESELDSALKLAVSQSDEEASLLSQNALRASRAEFTFSAYRDRICRLYEELRP